MMNLVFWVCFQAHPFTTLATIIITLSSNRLIAASSCSWLPLTQDTELQSLTLYDWPPRLHIQHSARRLTSADARLIFGMLHADSLANMPTPPRRWRSRNVLLYANTALSTTSTIRLIMSIRRGTSCIYTVSIHNIFEFLFQVQIAGYTTHSREQLISSAQLLFFVFQLDESHGHTNPLAPHPILTPLFPLRLFEYGQPD